MAAQIHIWVAVASLAIALLVGLEAGWRAIRRSPPGRAASRLGSLLLLAMGLAIAGGLGILAGGGTPRELLHFVYAVFAIGTLPVLAKISEAWQPRRRGFAVLFGAFVTLVAVLRLAATG